MNFNFNDQAGLEKLGAHVTAQEIAQQPELWQEANQTYLEMKDEIDAYLADIKSKHDQVRVVFTGAGTSAFTGEGITPYLNERYQGQGFTFEAVATTDFVSSPELYFYPDVPTILVSFARSGNSPESVATIELGQKIVKDFYQITITCAKEGKLAKAAEGDAKNLLILQPERSNDQGFAMTGSYTCMTLTALLVFDPSSDADKQAWVDAAVKYGQETLAKSDEIVALVEKDFDRVVYLGSGPFFGLAREAQLKILELTAGEIATLYDSPLGFRHGPKSFISDKTLVVVFASTNKYTRQYDDDLVNEVYHDKIATHTEVVCIGKNDGNDAEGFELTPLEVAIPDAYLLLPFVIFGQTFGLVTALKLGNKPDTPSPTGTVNRVVQGVIIHEY